jgi:hypothetical protein
VIYHSTDKRGEEFKQNNFPNWDLHLDEQDHKYIQETNAAIWEMNPLDDAGESLRILWFRESL